MTKTMALVPKISEKALGRTSSDKIYVFLVPKSANKDTVKQAVEAQFEVTVKNVRILVVKGKSKSSAQKRQRALDGRRADMKKAYVSLSKGNIPVLEESYDGD